MISLFSLHYFILLLYFFILNKLEFGLFITCAQNYSICLLADSALAHVQDLITRTSTTPEILCHVASAEL